MKDEAKTKDQLIAELLRLRQRVARLESLEHEDRDEYELLLNRERKYANAFRASPDSITMARLADGTIFDVNEGFLRTTGYSRDEVIGKSAAQLRYWVVPRDRKKCIGALRKTGESIGLETLFRAKHDAIIPGLISARVFEVDGEPCVLSVVREISRLKAMEQALRESEARYRRLFEESMDAIFFTTREGALMDVNPAMVALFGYSRQQLIEEMNAAQLYACPDGRQPCIREIERRGRVRDYPVRLRNSSGQEMDCVLSAVTRFARDGSLLGYQGIIRDVTEQKRAEVALKVSEARYRAIVEDQTELICRSRGDGTITFVNDAYCRYFEQQYEELVGRSFMPLIPEEDHAKVRAHFASLSLAQPVVTHEHRVIAPNGKVRWQQWTNRMILDDQHRAIEFQAVGQDITERKLMEQALQTSVEKIKLFVYSISHDLKNPAIGIHGLTKLLYRRYHDLFDDKSRTWCEQILKTSEEIVAFTQTINTFMAAKEVPLHIERIRLKEILDMVRSEYATGLDTRRVRWAEPEHLPEIRADRLGLIRILRNLVDNALKYGGDDLREIRIGYEESGDFHILRVEDDGVGIDRDHCEKIFRPFHRHGSSKGTEGLGLGLAIVKEIARQHGGRVQAEPGPQRGTIFSLSLAKHLCPTDSTLESASTPSHKFCGA